MTTRQIAEKHARTFLTPPFIGRLGDEPLADCIEAAISEAMGALPRPELDLMIEEWTQIALRTDAVAQRHKAKGERLQYLEQQAYATSRRACATQLKTWLENPSSGADGA